MKCTCPCATSCIFYQCILFLSAPVMPGVQKLFFFSLNFIHEPSSHPRFSGWFVFVTFRSFLFLLYCFILDFYSLKNSEQTLDNTLRSFKKFWIMAKRPLSLSLSPPPSPHTHMHAMSGCFLLSNTETGERCFFLFVCHFSLLN